MTGSRHVFPVDVQCVKLNSNKATIKMIENLPACIIFTGLAVVNGIGISLVFLQFHVAAKSRLISQLMTFLTS